MSAGMRDLFVAQYSSGGTHLWSRRFGDAGNDEVLKGAIAIDGNGGVILTGWFEGTVDFGTGLFTSTGSSDAFL